MWEFCILMILIIIGVVFMTSGALLSDSKDKGSVSHGMIYFCGGVLIVVASVFLIADFLTANPDDYCTPRSEFNYLNQKIDDIIIQNKLIYDADGISNTVHYQINDSVP